MSPGPINSYLAGVFTLVGFLVKLECMPREGKFEKIEKVRIPDEDMPGWIKTLREGGFTDEEMDLILTNLNPTYRKTKNPDFVEKGLEKLKEDLSQKIDRELTQEEIDCLRKGMESSFEDEE